MKKELPAKGEGMQQLSDTLPYAVNILLQSLMDLPVNKDKVKDAKFALSYWKGLKTLEKEERKVENANRRFNYKVLEIYGDEEDKKQIKAIIKGSLSKMKFIE